MVLVWSVITPEGRDRVRFVQSYLPVGDYAGTMPAACHWLTEQSAQAWRATSPVLELYPWELFDYAAEDAWLEVKTDRGC